MSTPTAPVRLGELVNARRLENGLMSRGALAEVSNLSVRTIDQIENGVKTSYTRQTLWKLDEALGWERGSAQRVLDGGEPTLLPASPSADSPESADAAGGDSLADLLLGDSAGDLDDDEIAEVESVARAAALKRKREILAARPAADALGAPVGPAPFASDDLPDFELLAARRVPSRPQWADAHSADTAGEDPQD